jgi:hypothetical protein
MTMQSLIAKLKQRPKTDDEHLAEQKREWVSSIRQLFADIEQWLSPAVSDGVLKTSRSETEIEEQDLGSYMVPVLYITDSRVTVRLEPIGAAVVTVFAGGKRHGGLRGSINLVCGPTKIPLARTQSGTWKAFPMRGEPRDLTSDTFSEILAEVLLDE